MKKGAAIGEISEHEFDQNLKGRAKKSAHVNYDDLKWVYFTCRKKTPPFLTLQDEGKKKIWHENSLECGDLPHNPQFEACCTSTQLGPIV